MSVNRRWLGGSLIRARVFGAGLALLGAGCIILGKSSHQLTAQAPASPASANRTATSAKHPATENSSSAEFFSEPARVDQTRSGHSFSPPAFRAGTIMSAMPLMFEPNHGQANLDPRDSRVRFIARGAGYILALGAEGAIVSVRSQSGSGASKSVGYESLEMKLVGANRKANIEAEEPLLGKSNYFLGNDPAKWRHDVPQFASVRYENVYPGINLVFYGHQGRLEHDFQIAPGADPSRAELEFDGARRLEVKDGALVILRHGAEMRLEAPRVYQEIAGREQPVKGHFVLRGANRAGFAIGPYDRSRELIIDPVLAFSTYFGGSGDELATSVTIDSASNIYLTGSTDSTNLPIVGTPFQGTLKSTPPATNVYVAKISPTTNPPSLVYVTYLGGTGSDSPASTGGIAVDGAGNAYLAGTTSSGNFPTTSTAYQATPTTGGAGSAAPGCSSGVPAAGSAGPLHVFVTELNTTGSGLNYSSYLSGNGNDVACGMALDASGNIYVTGTTTSNDTGSVTVLFPATTTPNVQAFQLTSKAATQFFVTKVSTTGVGTSSILYSTYFGGAAFNTSTGLIALGGGIAVDTNQNIYFSGTTNFVYSGTSSSTDFPILNAYQPCLDTPPPVVFTYNPTCSLTSGNPGNPDAFITKLLNPTGTGVLQGQQLQWSTYLGGSGIDSGTGIALDPGAANVYVTGTTNSTNFVLPANTGAFQSVPGGGNDAFVARFPNFTPVSPPTSGLSLAYFSYLGGSGNEAGLAITADNSNGAQVTGWTQSANFPVYPTASSIQSSLNGTQDAFVARLNTAAPVSAGGGGLFGSSSNQTGSWSTYFGGSTTSSGAANAVNLGTGIALDPNQNTYFAGSTNADNLQVATPLPTSEGGAYNGGFDAFVTELRAAPSVTISGVATLGTNQTFFPAGTPATFTYTITNQGPDPAYNLVVIDNLSQSTIGNNVALTFNSASSTAGSCNTATTNTNVSCTIGSLQAGSIVTVTFVVTPTANSSGTPETFNGGAVSVVGQNNITLAVTSVSAQMSDFGISVSPSNQAVPVAGDTATYQVQVTPRPVYGNPVALSCSNLPTGAACNFTPSGSATLEGSSPATVTLGLTTTAQSITTAAAQTGLARFFAVWFAIPGLALVGIGAKSERRRRWWRVAGLGLLLLMFSQLVPLPGCSSAQTLPPPTGTPAGQYTITLTAASGSDSKSVPIQLSVP